MKKILLSIFTLVSICALSQNQICQPGVTSINNLPTSCTMQTPQSFFCFWPMQTICAGGCVTLSATPNGNISNSVWSASSQNVTIQSPTSLVTQICFGNTVGTELINLFTLDTSGCQTLVACTFQVITCTGQADFFTNISEQCKLFPNPALENITLELPFNISNSSLIIYNTLGETVYNAAYQNFDINTTINIGMLSKGAYIIELRAGNLIMRKYFVKL